MVRIRLFESAAGALMESGRLPGFMHLYVGEEAVAVGVMTALTDREQITSTHRGPGHAIAKGGARMWRQPLPGRSAPRAQQVPADTPPRVVPMSGMRARLRAR